jgi:hypothetical protein
MICVRRPSSSTTIGSPAISLANRSWATSSRRAFRSSAYPARNSRSTVCSPTPRLWLDRQPGSHKQLQAGGAFEALTGELQRAQGVLRDVLPAVIIVAPSGQSPQTGHCRLARNDVDPDRAAGKAPRCVRRVASGAACRDFVLHPQLPVRCGPNALTAKEQSDAESGRQGP